MVEGAVLAAFLAFCRIGACFMLMPGLASARVPVNIRLFVAVAVSLALLAHLWDAILPAVDRRPAALVPLIAQEVLIGSLIGLMARFYLMAMQFIASGIAMMVGYGGMPGAAIEENDPQSPLGGIISFSALLVLFALDFHHQILFALVRSYEMAPLTQAFDAQSALADLSDTLSESFLVVLRLGSPFIAYAILVNIGTGLVNKLAPQIPVYFISLPFVIAGALILMYLSIGNMLSLFADGFYPTTIGR